MQFSDVIGQEGAKRKLMNMISSGRMPHALLISGSEGSGGLPLAFAIAQYLNCENPSETDSCGECNSCSKAKKFIHPDIFYTYPTIAKKSGDKPLSAEFITEWRKAINENPYITYNEWLDAIGAETKQGNITSNECHEIVRRISLKSYESKYKVQIVWLAELLRETGNVLLKSIEEPPPGTIFILVTEQPDLILTTILSRTQLLRLPPIETEAIEAALQQRLELDKRGGAPEIAHLSNGSWVAAMEFAQNEQIESEAIFLAWLRFCAGKFSSQTASGLMNWIDEFQTLGREKQKLLLQYGLFFIQNCLEEKARGNNRLQYGALEASKKIAARYPLETLKEVHDVLNKFHYHIERNAHAKIAAMSNSLLISEAFNA
jgi:DNA polymerase-3 subunit delta'